MGGLSWLLYAFLLQLSGPLQAEGNSLKCGLGSRLCKDGSECVIYSHLCDGELDCKDGSDEEDCTLGCNEDQFQCAHGKKCIAQDQVCDGVPQCQDRSDEIDCTKRTESCFLQCDKKSRCIPANFICDGELDCLDRTDEANCVSEDQAENTFKQGASPTSAPAISVGSLTPIKCPLGSRPCKNKVECVLFIHFCDGEVDCKDGSDEEECKLTCDKDQFQCAHGKKCIEQSKVCDGVPQCQDRSDELACAKRMQGCAHQCDGNSRCIPRNFLCDGEKDCVDASDEANCADMDCSVNEFKCTSGQCVSATIRCDGHPDCQDRSDEDHCTNLLPCTTKHRCPLSQECLVLAWICDGDQDCKDGTDEKDCPVAPLICGEFQWLCNSKTKCVPSTWRCDGMKDCDDGSDETDCGVVTCLPPQFQCGSHECLDPILVCNDVINCADGSDEGGSCHITCAEADHSRCHQGCYATPQGPHCLCTAGFRVMNDGQTCDDIDECEGQWPGVCSQLCVNTLGSYQCDCHPGYIMETDEHHCKITGEPFLLTSVQTDLFAYGLRSGRLDVLSSSAKKAILSLDYDWREQRVFWVSLDTESIKWSSLDQKTSGTLIKGVRADSVAVDWLGRNLYWIDGMNSQIVAVRLAEETLKSVDHIVILDEDLDQPRSLALLPQKGLMFWTEIGNVVKIERAGMDGSERTAVVNSSLGWPGGVAVDPISERVYWTDERLRAIGSATLDGDDVRILQMKETTNPFSLSVFNDMLYWSDAKNRVVRAAHKISGKNHKVLLKRPRQPFAVKVIHPLLQIGIDNQCEKMRCSHMCVLSPGPKAVCRCPAGLLAEDGVTCSSLLNSAYLLMLSSSTVTQIYLQSQHTATYLQGWPEHLALQVPGINEATIMDYSLHDHTLFVTDNGTSLGSFKLKGSNFSSQGQLLKLVGDTFTAMALDWITGNVYWSSNKQPGLQVTSITGAQTAVLIKEGICGVGSIALNPPKGRVCFTNMCLQGTRTVATVECADMDGAGRSVVWKDAVQPTSLVFSSNGDTIYWADTGLGIIGSVQLDGSGYIELKVEDGLAAVVLSGDALLWMTVSDKTRLWYMDEKLQNKLWFEVDAKVVSLKAFSPSSQTGSNECMKNNGNCHHLCLATPGGLTCKCSHDQILVNATHCGPQQHCPDGSRQCLEHCNDQSENCVGQQLSGVEVFDPTQPYSSSAPPSLPPVTLLSDVTGLNSSLNVNDLLKNLDAEDCSQKHCSGNGRCIETNGDTTCVCSLVYSGDSCQDNLLKNMQGPIVYGAAAICAAVVVIAVMAAVVKRKKANQRRASAAAVKGTSMTDLESKAETTQSTQMSPADTDKPEEAVSSVG